MTISRRTVLESVSALAIASAMPEAKTAQLLRGKTSQTSFNGGLTQMNTLSAQAGGQFLFINFIKASQEISYLEPPTDPNVPKNPILELDENGYPTRIVAGTNGYGAIVQIPNVTNYPGKWVLKWDGKGAAIPANFNAAITLKAPNRVEFVNRDAGANGTRAGWQVIAIGPAPNHLRNLRLCRIIDEAALDAGEQFFPDHMALMKSAKPGAIRSLGWLGGFNGENDSLQATWSQRRPVGHLYYQGYMFNPMWFGGTTTNSGTDYTLNYPEFKLNDKVAVQLIFNVSAVNQGRRALRWSTIAASVIKIDWPSHRLTIGNAVVFGDTPADPYTPPSALKSAQIYYVAEVLDENNFTVSATPSGGSVIATATANGSMWAIALHRININNTGFVPMTNLTYPLPENIGFSDVGPSASGGGLHNVSTIVFDATTRWFRLSAAGLMNGGPPEVFVDYCAAVGAHPWMVAPFLTMTPVQDFMIKWLTYVRDTYPWMKPLVEPPNETWNGNVVGYSTFYAIYMSFLLWGEHGNPPDPANQGYGKWVSDLGQAASALYGNDRTRYSMVCATQGVSFHGPAGTGSSNDPRLKSTRYVAAGGSPAYLWADRVCTANYYSPAARFTVREVIDAFSISVIHAGDPAAQEAIASNYAGTADGIDAPYTLPFILNCFRNMKTWAQSMPQRNTIKGMVCYEGGWSPDYLQGDWFTSMSSPGATQANPCVVTLNIKSTGNSEFSNISGNPAVVGMAVSISGVGGMTRLNTPAITSGATLTAGQADVAAANALQVNQAVSFAAGSGYLPSNVSFAKTYYVVAATSRNFQFSTTRGGVAIVPGVGGGYSNNVLTGWFVTAAGVNSVTLDVDSSAFPPWISGGKVSYMNSRDYSNALRQKGGDSAANGELNTKFYKEYFSLSNEGFVAEFPSNFIYFGWGSVWFVLQPNIYAPLTPQWKSIVAANAS